MGQKLNHKTQKNRMKMPKQQQYIEQGIRDEVKNEKRRKRKNCKKEN
jgi:hypothetical protein